MFVEPRGQDSLNPPDLRVWVRRTFLPFVLVLVMGIVGSLLVLHCTSSGVSLAPDAYEYVGAANSLRQGRGFNIPYGPQGFRPLIKFPPLYPLALASAGLASGLETVDAARWLQALMFGANVFLVGFTLLNLTRDLPFSGFVSALGAYGLLSSEDMILIHIHVWSEGVYFLFFLLGMLLLTQYLSRPKPWLLLASSVLIALAALSRYAGLSLIAAGLLSILGYARLDRGRKARAASLFFVLTSLPIAIWTWRNVSLAGTASGRIFVYHPPGAGDLDQALATISQWLLPDRVDGLVRPLMAMTTLLSLLALVALILLGSGLTRTKANTVSRPRLTAAPYAFCFVAYSLLLLGNKAFLDYQTGFDARILSPLYLLSLILVAGFLNALLASPYWPIRLLTGVAILFLVSLSFAHGRKMVTRAHGGEFKGYASEQWSQLPLMSQIQELPWDVPVFSNAPDAIYLVTGKPAMSVPAKFNPNSLLPNASFGEEMLSMRNVMASQNGVLLYFREIEGWRRYLPGESEIQTLLVLVLRRDDREGALYRVSQGP